MYGLQQAAVLAYNNLINNLKADGYTLIKHMDSYWKTFQISYSILFMCGLFWNTMFQQTRFKLSNSTLQKYYKICTEYSGTNHCGLTMEWNYIDGYVDVSMPGYVKKVLKKFQLKNLPLLNYLPTNGIAQILDPEFNYQHHQTICQNWTKKIQKMFNQSQDRFLSMAMP